MQARFKALSSMFVFPIAPHFLLRIAASLLIAQSAVAAISPADEQVHFVIRDYEIEGAQMISAERLRLAVAPFIGPSQTFADIQRAVAAIDVLYADVGFSATQVRVEPQDITKGTVRVKVVESTVGSVNIIGNQYFDPANIRSTLPQLVSGQAPNVRELGTAVRLANESYAKQTQVTFRQGEKADTVDALVRISDSDPVRHVVTIDNTGGQQAGKYRTGYAFQHANLFNRDHLLTAQYVTSPGHISDVTIFGANYRLPFYSIGGALDFSASYSNVNSGIVATTAGSYSISGSGTVMGVRYTQLLQRIGDWDQRVTAGIDYRYFQNKVLPNGTNASLVPDLVSRPLTFSYSGFARSEQREWRASISAAQNIPGGGKGSTAAFQAPGSRAGATANFRTVRFNGFAKQSLPANWALQAQFSGQYSGDALISGEQFGIGGVESVRGFREREVLNDRGYRTSLELQSPNMPKMFGTTDTRTQVIAFYDAGSVRRNKPLPGENTATSISSAGAGLRVGLGNSAQIRLDLASVLQGGGVRRSGEKMLHANLTFLF